ncbi:uncharacterized protein METZ01_LOCUS329946, partial [marine metagenome]
PAPKAGLMNSMNSYVKLNYQYNQHSS